MAHGFLFALSNKRSHLSAREIARHAGRERLRLGDRIEAGLKRIGVHQAVKAIERRTGWNCGCARRKAILNRLLR